MVLSTTISQRTWTDVHVYAMSHGKSVSEVVEALLMLGTGLSPYQDFLTSWYETRSPEESFDQLMKGREKSVPASSQALDPTHRA